MNRSISRRDFLKGTAAAGLGFMTSGIFSNGLTAFAEEKGVYTPGTYSATAQGIGEVKVTMTFDADSILEVTVDTSEETDGIGRGLGEQFAEQLLANQGSGIDAVSGASLTSGAVKQAAEACIAQAKGNTVDTGAAEGEKEKTWRDAPDPISDSEIAEVIETDVAIIGLGHAGLAVYRAAAEGGANVVAVEAQPRESWWTVGHDIGHINSKLLESRGVPKVDPVEFLNNWMLQSHCKANPQLVMKFAKNSGDAIDWYLEPVPQDVIDQGRITYWPDNEYTVHELNTGYKYYTGTVQFWQANWEDPFGNPNAQNNTPGKLEVKDLSYANFNEVESKYPNAQALFGSKGKQLLIDDGKVSGVIVERADGSFTKIIARKGVVLAGGGFAGNAEMREDLLAYIKRLYTPDEDFKSMFGRDGSAIQMGVWAGGHLESEISTMNFDSVYMPDNIPGPLWVDDEGKRFMNEAVAGTEISGFLIPRSRRGKVTAIYDSSYPTQILRGFPMHGGFQYEDENVVNAKKAQFEAARGAGADGADGFYCADTLEELADYIGADRETFLATIEQYNARCAEGVDTDFGKDPHFLNPVAEGPFYAHVTTVGVGFALVSTGGLVTTENQQVVDAYYRPIEGLYATGNSCGGRFGPAYVTPIPGLSIGMCITLGRELGKYLSEEI